MGRPNAGSQLLGLAGALLAISLARPAAGQGLPNQSYSPAQVGQVLARIDASLGAPRGHGSVMMHRGVLAVIFSRDSGKGDGGFAFFDISDPAAPSLVFAKDDEETEDIREAHGFGVVRHKDRDLFFFQASFGVQIWDFTDVSAPTRVAYLRLPGITDSDYATGAWFAFPQWPYLYLGGSSNGLYIIDIRDPSAPFLVDRGALPNPIPPTLLGDFKTGPVYAAGGLLTLCGMDQPGFSTLDISKPTQPLMLSTRSRGLDSNYSALFNGGLIYGAGTQSHVNVYDVRDPLQIVDYARSDAISGRGGYLSVQDGVAHVGESEHFVVIDFNTPSAPRVLLDATSGVPGRDEDFATVLGNLTIVSDDHGNGSFIIPHQAAPDTTPPEVNFLSPTNGAVGQSVDLRVGVTFSDAIDFQSVDEASFQLRVAGGEAVPGVFSYQMGVLNFGPEAPLSPDTTYELELPAGGIRDVAGNPLARPLVSIFSTGQLAQNPACVLSSGGPTSIGDDTRFELSAAGDAYAWDFGDGERQPTPAAGAVVTHRYAAPGHYSVLGYVYSAGKLLTTCSITQTVHRPALGRAPSSRSFAVDEATGRVWVTNRDHGSVSVLDGEQRRLLAELPVPSQPRSLALGKSPDNSRTEAWVVSDEGRSLSVFDADSQQPLHTLKLPWGSRPSGVVLTEDGRAFVSLRGSGRLLDVDRQTFQVLRELELDPGPFGLAYAPESGELYVSHFISARDHGRISVIDTAAWSITRSVLLNDDPGPDTENSARGIPNYLRALQVSPDRQDVWVVGKKDNTSRGWWRDGEPLTHESTVRSVAARLALGAATEDPTQRFDLDDRNLPSAIDLSPLGDLAFIATQGSNSVEVLDAYSGRRVTSLDRATQAPEGVWLDSSGTRLYVHGFLSRSVAIYDVGSLVAAGSNRAELLAEISTTSTEVLAPDVLAGKRVFYDSSDFRMSRDNYLSCATCHLDGEHDGRVWDFTNRGEGLRNTSTLLGKRGGQGRLHWSGNFDEVQDFEHDIRGAFGGAGFISDADFTAGRELPLGATKAGASPELDQLAAYLGSLERVPDSPFRTAYGELSRAAERGQAHFERLACASCHGGADYTNSAQDELYDVGTLSAASGLRLGDTLTGIDTPTLLGLWASAPYLHDGSADSIEDVLERAAASGKHGDVQSLSPTERSELAAFLRELDQSEPEAAPVAELAESGCGCEMTSRNRLGGAWLGLALLLGVARRRRHMRSRRQT